MEAPLGTAARNIPPAVVRSTSTVGLPRESKIMRACGRAGRARHGVRGPTCRSSHQLRRRIGDWRVTGRLQRRAGPQRRSLIHRTLMAVIVLAPAAAAAAAAMAASLSSGSAPGRQPTSFVPNSGRALQRPALCEGSGDTLGRLGRQPARRESAAPELAGVPGAVCSRPAAQPPCPRSRRQPWMWVSRTGSTFATSTGAPMS